MVEAMLRLAWTKERETEDGEGRLKEGKGESPNEGRWFGDIGRSQKLREAEIAIAHDPRLQRLCVCVGLFEGIRNTWAHLQWENKHTYIPLICMHTYNTAFLPVTTLSHSWDMYTYIIHTYCIPTYSNTLTLCIFDRNPSYWIKSLPPILQLVPQSTP